MKSLPEGTAGTWSCLGGAVRVVWDNGFVDRDSISEDGTQLSAMRCRARGNNRNIDDG